MFSNYQIALLIPLGWFLVSLISRYISLTSTIQLTRMMSYAGLAIAILMANILIIVGSGSSPLIGWNEIGLSVRIDSLSITLLSLVSFIAILVLRFSVNYLDGDPDQQAFLSKMSMTLACTSLLMISGNMIQFVFAWIGTSLALHTLLVFYPERPGAVIAARKKWFTARAGDILLILAAILLVDHFGTSDLSMMFEQAKQMAHLSPSIQLACLFIALAALLKSAQFPTHGWLLEVMETPTPVSALLHAGIINAGGFLIMRFADIMILHPTSMHLIAIVGGFTALFAGLVMLTQPAVKTALAWSTIAQMGFMMLQCGLGAFSIAVLHLVAHSLYKAHAFLSSGSIIDIARASRVPKSKIQSQQLRVLLSMATALSLYLTTTYVFFAEHMFHPVNLTLGVMLVMGLTHLVLKSLEDNPGLYSMLRVVATAASVSLIFNILHYSSMLVYGGLFPNLAEADNWDYLVIALTLSSFSLVMYLQIFGPAYLQSKTWSRIYVHLINGFYLNAYFDRLVGTYQLNNSKTIYK